MSTVSRIEREKQFHDLVFDEHSTSSRRTLGGLQTGIVDRPKDLAHRLIVERCNPKRILEYGCGPGWYAQRLAQHFVDAEVVGIDLSDVAVERAGHRTESLGLRNVTFRAMDAEHLDFENGTFDVVTGLGILHHLDLEKALAEIERVLAPQGTAVFVEPLAHNPGLRLFRRITPTMRTVDEHPLTMRDLDVIKSHFDGVENHFVNLMTLCAVPVPRWLGRMPLIAVLGACDHAVFSIVPFSRRFAWSVVSVCCKARESRMHSAVRLGPHLTAGGRASQSQHAS